VEVLSLSDVEHAVQLVLAALRRIRDRNAFIPS